MTTSGPLRPRAFALALLSLAIPTLAAPPAYTITPLTTGLPDPYAYPFSINDHGTVALWGYDPQSSTTQAYLWTAGAAAHVPTPPGHAYVFHVGPAGAAVGQVLDPLDGTARAFRYDPATDTLTYPTLSGQSLAFLYSINAHDLAVGTFADPATGQWSAALWDPTAGASLLPALGNGTTAAFAINNAGQAVGSSGDTQMDAFPANLDNPLGQEHAVLWQPDGTLVDLTPTHPWSAAYDINDRGQVVGEYMHLTYVPYPEGPAVQMNSVPFLYDPDRGLITLPTPAPDSHTVAQAINESGWVVGRTAPSSSNDAHALLWSPDGTPYDLTSLLPNDSGWTLKFATDINAAGQIIGTGTYLGQPAAFLLTPTPEPSTMALLSCAILPLLRRRRRPI